MHLFLAIFWVVVAVVVQIYWDDLKRHAWIPVDRMVMIAIFFVLFSYNLLRWRLARSRERLPTETQSLPPRPRVVDPTFDFSDAKAENKKSEPEAKAKE